MLKEFREFINRGNVVDLSVGVIVGGAFGKIVSSLVDNVLMPIIGIVIGGIDFSNLCGINPNLSVTIMGAGFANDITILLFFSITTLELVVSEKIHFILDYVDTMLWKLLKN